jgi:single-strand DNA-binding protein
MKVITIAGRVGKDAELRRTQSGDPVLGFSIAVDDGYGQNKRTLWFDASIWGKRGEALADHLKKGTPVTVSGDLSTREHDGKTYLTVRVSEVTLQGGKQDGERRESRPARQEQGMYDRDDPRTGGGSYADELNDDLPF